MMSRTQIYLDSEVHRRARKRADDLGVSLAEYIRRLVNRDLGGSRKTSSPSTIFDLGSSGGSDIARNKSAMLAEAFSSSHKRRKRS